MEGKGRDKKIRLSRVFVIIFLILFALTILNNIYKTFYRGKFYLVDKAVPFYEAVEMQGFLIYDELVTVLPEGSMNNLPEQSIRIPRGQGLGKVSLGDIANQLNMQRDFIRREKKKLRLIKDMEIEDLQLNKIVSALSGRPWPGRSAWG